MTRRAPAFWTTPGSALGGAMAPLSWIVGRVAARRMRRAPAYRAAVPVICIGNLVAGGQGKTPLAFEIARRLRAGGCRPVFLSRGYGGSLNGPVLVTPSHTAAEVGDEPCLLANAAPCVVSADRAAGARLAETLGDAIVMDDGFQNPSLAKTVSILVADAGFGLGNGRVLPAGPLRAPLAAQLARADALVLIGEGAPGDALAARVGALPVLRARFVPDRPQAFAGARIVAFAGIGRPEKFFETLEAAGAELIAREAFADHRPYAQADARRLLRLAEGARLVTTAKDKARIGAPAPGSALAELAERAEVLNVSLAVDDRLDDVLRQAFG